MRAMVEVFHLQLLCFYSPHLTARNGAMTTALMLETLSKHDEPLSTLISDLPVYYQSKTKFQCTVSKRNSVIDIIKQNTNKKFDDSDGLKIWQDEKSWVLIRPSGTEPIIRLFGESNTKEKLDSVMSFYSDKITSDSIQTLLIKYIQNNTIIPFYRVAMPNFKHRFKILGHYHRQPTNEIL